MAKATTTVQKPVIRTPYTNKYFPKQQEPENLVGKTVPDLSMTIKQILNRHGVGGIFQNGKQPVWLGDVELPNIELMELQDVMTLQEQVMERIAIRRKQELDAKEEERKRQKEEEVDKLAQAKLDAYLKKKRFIDRKSDEEPTPNT